MGRLYLKSSQILLRAALFVCCTLALSPPGKITASPVALAPPPPAWTINPTDFQFNMSVLVRIRFEGVPANNTGNLVGAFVGSELRGVATETDVNGEKFYFLTVYSNDYAGETVNFRAYYAPEDAVYAAVQTEPFGHNRFVGSLSAPFWIDIDPNTDFPPDLQEPLKDTTLVGIPFDPIVLADYLISSDGDPVSWSTQAGDNLMATINNGILTVAPVSPVWTGTDTVRITATENTTNQYSAALTACFTVLPDYGPLSLGPIPPQTIFVGGLFTGFDLDDYLLFNGPCRMFDFEVHPWLGTVAAPGWLPVAPGAQSMQLKVRPLFADEALAGAGAVLAAFVNNTLVGTAGPTGTPPNVSYALNLKNVASSAITFQFYHAENQYLYEKTTTLNFVPGGSVGTVSSPYLLQLSPLVPTLAADGNVQISIEDPVWLGTYPVDFIAWDCDFPNLKRDTASTSFSVVEDQYPHLSSPPNVNFEENSCVALYDAETTDPQDVEGNGLTYLIDGGTDAALFAIDPVTGELTWKNFAPDFEIPGDANLDNQYELIIRVTNTMDLSDVLTVVVTVTDNPNEPFAPQINGGVSVCLSGTATLQTSGGGSYLWSTGATTVSININTPGTYAVTVTNTASCTATAEATVLAAPAIMAEGSSAPVCQGATVTVSSTPSGGSGTYTTFAWTGPGGYTALVEDPPGFPAMPSAEGTYTVTLTDDAGCTASATTAVAVSPNSAPTILAFNDGPKCAGLDIVLNSQPSGGSGSYTTYKWAGPANYISTVKTPLAFTASLAKAGVYTVTVTDNAGCTAAATTTVQVFDAPTILAENNGPVCTGTDLINLTSNPSGGSGSYLSFAWTGPDNYMSNKKDPFAILPAPATAGQYQVVVTDDQGCTGAGTTTVVVGTAPIVAVSAAAPVCEGGSLILNSTVTGGSGNYPFYSWAGPASFFSFEKTPPAIPATMNISGAYVLTVVDNLGCFGKGTSTFTVRPVPGITATNNGPICAGKNLVLTSTPTGGSGTYTSFKWTGPGAYIATPQYPAPFTTTAASTGTYQVQVTDNQGCTATATTDVVVFPKPSITAQSNTPLCLTALIDLRSTPTGGSGNYFSFTWTGPNNFISTVEDPPGFPATLAASGFYQVLVTDDMGCTATASTGVSVSINAAPVVVASASSPVCVDGQILLNSMPSAGAGGYSFNWSGPNSYQSQAQNPAGFTAAAASAGTYAVTVTDSKGCAGTSSASVEVNAPEVEASSNSPVCGVGDNILLSSTPTGGSGSYTSFSWAGPNGYVGVGQEPVGFPALLDAGGTYTVTVTDSEGCTGTATTEVQVGDIEPPTISCPADQTVAADANCEHAIGNQTGMATSLGDDCTAPNAILITQMPNAATKLTVLDEPVEVMLTADDGNGHTASCSYKLTLKDVTVPEITCLPIPTVRCAFDLPDPNTGTVLASDNCGGVAVTYLNTSDPYDQTCTDRFKVDRVYRALDLSGNTNTCVQVITVFDDQAPVFLYAPPDETVECNEVPLPGTTAVEDNCMGMFTVDYEGETVIPGTCPGAYTLVRQWTTEDGCANSATVSQTITVRDTKAPVFMGVPGNVTVECTNIPELVHPTIVDNCDANPLLQYAGETIATGTCPDQFTLIRQWTVMDECGNEDSIVQRIEVRDMTPPLLSVPADLTLICSDPVPPLGEALATDNCVTEPVIVFLGEWNMGANGPGNYTIMRLWQATDNCGNTATGAQFIDIQDDGLPYFTNVPPDLTLECDQLVPSIGQATASDACENGGSVDVKFLGQVRINGPNFQNYTLVRTWRATDLGGNSVTASQTILVQDTQAPVFTNAPADVTANCGDLPALPLVFATDHCDSYVPVVFAGEILIPGGDCAYTILRNWTVTDDTGNSNAYTQTITVQDTQAPVFTNVPPNLTISCTSGPPPMLEPTVQDNCDADIVLDYSELISPGNCPQAYTLVRTWTAADDCGNQSSVSQTIEVADLEVPKFEPACTVFFEFYTEDAGGVCPADLTPSIFVGQVISVQDGWAVGSFTIPGLAGCVSDDCTDATDLMVRVISLVNSGTDCDQVISAKYRLIDACGNESTKTFQQLAIIHDNTKPVFTDPPADVTVDCAPPLPVAPLAVDNCAGPLTVKLTGNVTVPGGCTNTYVLLRTWRATDACGNSTTVTHAITVRDNEPPVFTKVPPSVTISCNAPMPLGKIKAVDNCSAYTSVKYTSTTVVSSGCPYILVRMWTATDYCGNTATATQQITFVDNEPPIIRTGIPVSLTVECGNIPLVPSIQARDKCDDNLVVNFEETLLPGACDDEYTIQRLWIVTDACGNTATRSQYIYVQDNTPPQFTSVPSTVSTYCTTVPPVGSPQATDNCTAAPVITYDGQTQSPGDCSSGYTITRKWTVLDNCGHTNTATQQINVLPQIVGNDPDWDSPPANLNLIALEDREQHWQKPLKIVLAPNPASDLVGLRFKVETAGEVSIQLIGLDGRSVQMERFWAETGLPTFYLDLTERPSGIYLIRVATNGQLGAEKLMVLRR